MRPRALLALAAALAACGPAEDALVTSLPVGVAVPDGMVFVPGSVQPIAEADARGMPRGGRRAAPEEVRVQGFFADRTEVTNEEFAAFVAATGYRTDAERIGDSVVFQYGAWSRGEPLFALVAGADWRHPEGPRSSIDARARHPVVNVSWNDARAYAEWAGKRLPTRGEWYAMARAGLDEPAYPWGDELAPDGRWAANVWQGPFPAEDHGRDGYVGTAPVGSFPVAPSGLFDLGGNVWEWTAETTFGLPADADPTLVPASELAVVRGGSFLCREEALPPLHACRGYLIGQREEKMLTDGNNQVGFRCVMDLPR